MRDFTLAIFISAATVFTFTNCGSNVLHDLLGDDAQTGAILPSECPQVAEVSSGTPMISFSSKKSNAFEGFKQPDDSRADGEPITVNICFNRALPEGIALEFEVINEDNVARDTDYRITSDDQLGESNFLLLTAGRTSTKLMVTALGDSNNDDDEGSFAITLKEEKCETDANGEEAADCDRAFELKSPSLHQVFVLDPVDINISFAEAAFSFNEDTQTPDMIMLSSQPAASVNTFVRFEVTGGTAQAEDYELPGVRVVSGSPGQYEYTFPAGSSSAGIPIDAVLDPDKTDETITLTLLDNSGYNPDGQTTHTATIVSRPISGFELVGSFRGDNSPIEIPNSATGNNRLAETIAIDPDGDIYIAYPVNSCVRRFSFTEGETAAESRLTFKSRFIASNNGECDRFGTSPVAGLTNVARLYNIKSVEIEGGSYLFMGSFDGVNGSDNQFVIYYYDSSTQEYGVINNMSVPGTSGTGLVSGPEDIGVDVINQKIYVVGNTNATSPQHQYQYSYTVNANNSLNLTREGVLGDVSVPANINNYSTICGGLTDCNSGSLNVNPHTGDIYWGLFRRRISGGFPRLDEHRVLYTFRFNNSVSSDVKWELRTSLGNCGAEAGRFSGAEEQIAFGPDGSVFIPDFNKYRTQVFSVDTNSNLTYLASAGSQPDQLGGGCGGNTQSDDKLHPRGVAIDAERQLLYVVGREDPLSDSVSEFYTSGLNVYRIIYGN